MAAARAKGRRKSYIAVPSEIIHSLSSTSLHGLFLLSPPKIKASRSGRRLLSPKLLLLLLFLLAFFGTLRLGLNLDPVLPCPHLRLRRSARPYPARLASFCRLRLRRSAPPYPAGLARLRLRRSARPPGQLPLSGFGCPASAAPRACLASFPFRASAASASAAPRARLASWHEPGLSTARARALPCRAGGPRRRGPARHARGGASSSLRVHCPDPLVVSLYTKLSPLSLGLCVQALELSLIMALEMAAEEETIISVDENPDVGLHGSSDGSADEEHRRRRPIRRDSFGGAYKIPQRPAKKFTRMQTAALSFQALGVVYGDLGTSPLYVFNSISLDDPGRDDVLGILSLIFWTLTSIALVKYMFIVLHADDHGEGGTFALYSLLRQHVNFKSKMIAGSTRMESDIRLEYTKDSGLRTRARSFLERSRAAQNAISFIVLVGTCMVIGDGVLTPAISVLSSVQGIQSRSSNVTQENVVAISVAILLFLFLVQRFGTSKVSISFSPIMVAWFLFTAGIGVYNIAKYYPPVFKAVSPHYIYLFFKRNGIKGWELTGAEATFADMGHFSRRAIQIAFSSLVYPSLILAYSGEAAFLIKNPDKLSTTFYSSVPERAFWPMFVVATLAAIVASQSLISASFSIIRQSIALGCFPRVTIIHTSGKHEGQVYSPEVNYLLMVLCVLVTVSFKGGAEIGNAFGVAVIWVMLITTALIVVVMLVIWNTNLFLVAIFFLFFAGFEGLYLTSLLKKLPQGGWVPFAISTFFLAITLSWTYGRSKRSDYESTHKLSAADFHSLAASTAGRRVPGICFFCTDLVNGIPPIVRHYTQHVGSLRQVMVLVTVRILPVRSVLPGERFEVARLGPLPASAGLYRCLVQYGYMDEHSLDGEEFAAAASAAMREAAESEEEAELLDAAARSGAIFVLGRIILKTNERRSWIERLAIDNLYRFLQKNFRSDVATLKIPPGRILQVGMQYEV